MDDSPTQPQASRSADADEMISVMFAQMVMQQSNMAMIFLGKTPNPQTGQTEQDLNHARYFIDQLEMLAVKTRGNLNQDEDGLLKQTLTGLRLAFVEAVSKPQAAPAPSERATANESPRNERGLAAEAAKPSEGEPAAEAEQAESHKKFSKKY
jgi:Domain of unknown function (DUF1844)